MSYNTRSYAQPYLGGGGAIPDGLRMLLIANAAVFLLGLFGLQPTISSWFGLTPSSVVGYFAIWQLFTYLFVHGGFMHILFNMLILWMFGRELEAAWGKQRFLNYYFVCGIGAGVCIVIFNYLAGIPNVNTVGASGAIYGILLASAVMWPDRTVYFWMLFPIPMKYLVILYGAISLYGSLNVNSGISHIGHLGGLLIGYLYLKSPRVRGLDPIGSMRQQYKEYKIARAKKKFQVYMKKHQRSDHDTVN